MKPYYEEDGVVIYHGDCREVLPNLEAVDSVITDPVWPNSSPYLIGSERPAELFAEAAALFNARRVVVQLGCDSDPRFLYGLPARLPYFRTCWLEYACPSNKGRVLYTGDVAYAFGEPPPSVAGRRVIPGRAVSTKHDGVAVRVHDERRSRNWGKLVEDGSVHVAPRRFQHVQWLVRWFADGVVCDPFAGTGTTLDAAKRAGHRAIGIEIVEGFCEQMAERLSQQVMQFGTS